MCTEVLYVVVKVQVDTDRVLTTEFVVKRVTALVRTDQRERVRESEREREREVVRNEEG